MNVKLFILCIIIVTSFPVNVFSRENSAKETKCKPLTAEIHFDALGYQLGSCKFAIEETIKKKDTTTKKSAIAESFQDSLNSDLPSSVSYITSNYINANPPYERLLSDPPIVALGFYDNVLFGVGCSFLYSDEINADQFADIEEIYKNYLDNKYAKSQNEKLKAKKSVTRQWISDGVEISFRSDFNHRTITISYVVIDIYKKYERDISNMKGKKELETQQKAQENQIDGF